MKRRLTIRIAAFSALLLLSLTPSWAAQPVRDEMIPLIEMDEVPLTEAIRAMARKARLNILLDPRLSEPPFDRVVVTVRWENVTAREALIALLENYDLKLVETGRLFPPAVRKTW